jgi:PAS domain S-box-containing protein
MILIGILLAGLYWLLESFVHSQIFYQERPDFLHQVLLPDAHEIWMRLVIVILFISFASYAQWTVSKFKAAENAIRQANKKLTLIFETAADGMRVVDRDLNILEVNTTFLTMIGLSREDVIGKKCYDVFSGTACHGDKCPMYRILAGEERIEYDETKTCRDGKTIPCIVTAIPFRNENGQLIGIVEDFKDISDRKQAEEDLRKSHAQLRELSSHMEVVREEERRKMAREIHDELGQALTVLKMDISWLSHHLTDDKNQIENKLDELSGRIDATIHTVQRLSSELRPGMLDDLGISAAIEWQANQIRDRTNITFDIVSTPEDITLDATSSITFFRIFQETLTNIVRHSGATQVEVNLNQDEKNTTMTVSDNGKGISRQQVSDPTSLGLIGIRERVSNIDGLFKLSSESGKGTTIFISIPTSPKPSREDV